MTGQLGLHSPLQRRLDEARDEPIRTGQIELTSIDPGKDLIQRTRSRHLRSHVSATPSPDHSQGPSCSLQTDQPRNIWHAPCAEAGRARPKAAKLAGRHRLRSQVEDQLKTKFSPEQISNRLKIDFPDDPEMRVSHETIYQSLYVQGRGALRRDLHTCLRTGRAVRRPHRKSGERRGRIPDMIMISERPAEVDDRAVPGHWEGDLIVGAFSKSAIGTLVERTSRYTMLLHLPLDHTAGTVQDAMVAAVSRLPATLWKTLTWDQGSEMTNHAAIAAATDLDIYFCDPHAPWLRGSNENTNGLLRQYFPKGTDLSQHSASYLDHVAAELNNRPRKTLGWQTPTETLDRLLS